ncbi:hypothetical protein KC322_g94 [Hortaea werneckii]|nr:hypothetical protein KC322_g94 [Hortaea werneckii]
MSVPAISASSPAWPNNAGRLERVEHDRVPACSGLGWLNSPHQGLEKCPSHSPAVPLNRRRTTWVRRISWLNGERVLDNVDASRVI